jgi:predicted DNA-binding transcriptional regulator AlpA
MLEMKPVPLRLSKTTFESVAFGGMTSPTQLVVVAQEAFPPPVPPSQEVVVWPEANTQRVTNKKMTKEKSERLDFMAQKSGHPARPWQGKRVFCGDAGVHLVIAASVPDRCLIASLV